MINHFKKQETKRGSFYREEPSKDNVRVYHFAKVYKHA